jgi:hypothetical protein
VLSACRCQDTIEETNGAELVSGGTAKLKEQLKKLDKGGVLFVDEAYQLDPKMNPMGQQVIESGSVKHCRLPARMLQQPCWLEELGGVSALGTEAGIVNNDVLASASALSNAHVHASQIKARSCSK